MLLGLYYISAKNRTLKLFTGVTSNDLIVLTLLDDLNAPCHFKRLYDLLGQQGNGISSPGVSNCLRRCVEKRYVSRTPVAGNVLYCITLDGKRLLYAYNEELNNFVNARINKLHARIA